MYKSYIFDLYGTLIDIRTDEWSDTFWNRFACWLTEQGMPYSMQEVRKLYEAEVKKLVEQPSEYDCPEIDILPVFAKICRNRKADITDEQVWKVGEQFRILSTEFVKLYPDSKKVLTELKKSGKNVYLLSNAQRVFTRRELEITGILHDFDDIFISSDAGCKKPDKAFFEKLLQKHGLKVSECVMIGNDGSTDIAGARSVGMDAVYIRTAISPENEPVPDCKYVFEDGEIRHVLEL